MTNPHRPMIDSGIFVKKRASVTASVTASATASVTPAGSGGKRPESVDARRPTPTDGKDPIADPIPARVCPDADNRSFIVPSPRNVGNGGGNGVGNGVGNGGGKAVGRGRNLSMLVGRRHDT